jgi:hypothetical protein
MANILTWHDLYSQLVRDLREHFPEQLSDDPDSDELRGAIGLLEYVDPIQRFPHPNSVTGVGEFVGRCVDARDILSWAENDGPLSACD